MLHDPDDMIEEWILDYICFRAWKEFKLSKVLTNPTLDYISAVVQQTQNYKGTRLPKVYFLVVLIRLADGQKCFVDYTDHQELTVLEDMIPIFKKLAHHQTSSLLQEGLDLIHVIKIEALLVCWRAKDPELQKKVYKRQWLKEDGKEKDISESLRDFLGNLLNPMEENTVIDVTYDDFLDSMIKYLDHVQKTFNEPQLLKFAEAEKTQINGEVAKKTFAGKKFTKDDFEKTSVSEDKSKNPNEDFAHSKAKLRKLWNNNVQEIFGSTSPGRHSTRKGQTSQNTPTRKRSSESDLDLEPPLQKNKVTSSANQLNLLPSTSSEDNSKTPQKQTSEENVFVSPTSLPLRSPAISRPVGNPSRPVYRKNQDRLNRHEPLANTSNNNDDSDSSSSNDSCLTTCSVATMRRKWDNEEMEEFYDAVKVFGVGQWAKIKNYLGTGRSNVMLKDKWRNMLKSGDVLKIKERKKAKKKK